MTQPLKTTRAKLRAFTAPILRDNPELVRHSRRLILPPVAHVCRFVMLDASSTKDMIRPSWGVVRLFEPKVGLGLGQGGPIFRETPPHRWYLTDLQGAHELSEIMRTRTVPALRAIQTLEDYLAFCEGPFGTLRGSHWSTAVVLAAVGRFDEARAIFRKLEDPIYRRGESEMDARMLAELRPPLYADDRAGVARILHGWEQETVRATRLEDLWQPSPFPFEERRSQDCPTQPRS